MNATNADLMVLESGVQRLRVVPTFGGSVASWDWKLGDDWSPLFRPWDGASEDRYTLACFPLVPWSNRITQGGFEQDGVFYPIRQNRIDEPYPIHGDGWLQAWSVAQQSAASLKLMLESNRFDDDPYRYRSTENFTLLPNGLQIDLTVTNTGDRTLPFGLGLHPYFMRNAQTLLQATAEGVWLSGDDPIPTEYTTRLPPTWDYNQPAPLDGPLIDNCFKGWNGKALIRYPDRGLTLAMQMFDCNGYSLMYRPPDLDYFCFEPITHPIDAFHMPDRPGLAFLAPNDSLALRAKFLVTPSSGT
jgi:aldose 1-epimerase